MNLIDLPGDTFERIVNVCEDDNCVKLILDKFFNILDLDNYQKKLAHYYKEIQSYTRLKQQVPKYYEVERLNMERTIELENVKSVEIDENLEPLLKSLTKEKKKELEKIMTDFKALI